MILILQIVALICLLLAALPVPVPKVSVGWLGMFLWLLSLMIGSFGLHVAR